MKNNHSKGCKQQSYIINIAFQEVHFSQSKENGLMRVILKTVRDYCTNPGINTSCLHIMAPCTGGKKVSPIEVVQAKHISNYLHGIFGISLAF